MWVVRGIVVVFLGFSSIIWADDSLPTRPPTEVQESATIKQDRDALITQLNAESNKMKKAEYHGFPALFRLAEYAAKTPETDPKNTELRQLMIKAVAGGADPAQIYFRKTIIFHALDGDLISYLPLGNVVKTVDLLLRLGVVPETPAAEKSTLEALEEKKKYFEKEIWNWDGWLGKKLDALENPERGKIRESWIKYYKDLIAKIDALENLLKNPPKIATPTLLLAQEVEPLPEQLKSSDIGQEKKPASTPSRALEHHEHQR